MKVHISTQARLTAEGAVLTGLKAHFSTNHKFMNCQV